MEAVAMAVIAVFLKAIWFLINAPVPAFEEVI